MRITAMRRYPDNPGIIDLQVESGWWFWKKTEHRAVSQFIDNSRWVWCDTHEGCTLNATRAFDGFVRSNAIQWVRNDGFVFEEETYERRTED